MARHSTITAFVDGVVTTTSVIFLDHQGFSEPRWSLSDIPQVSPTLFLSESAVRPSGEEELVRRALKLETAFAGCKMFTWGNDIPDDRETTEWPARTTLSEIFWSV